MSCFVVISQFFWQKDKNNTASKLKIILKKSSFHCDLWINGKDQASREIDWITVLNAKAPVYLTQHCAINLRWFQNSVMSQVECYENSLFLHFLGKNTSVFDAKAPELYLTRHCAVNLQRFKIWRWGKSGPSQWISIDGFKVPEHLNMKGDLTPKLFFCK